MSNNSNKFAPGMELADRSACDSDCIFRGTVIRRTAKQVTIDCGRKEVVTVKIHVADDGGEYCFPFGRYSMATVFNAGETIREPKPEASPQVKVHPSCFNEVKDGKMINTAGTDPFDTVEVQAATPAEAGEMLPEPPVNLFAFVPAPKPARTFTEAVRMAIDAYAELSGKSVPQIALESKDDAKVMAIIEALTALQGSPETLRRLL